MNPADEESSKPWKPETGTVLDLSHHNTGHPIGNGYRIRPEVTELDLTHNRIESMEGLRHLTRLTSLRLRQNLLTQASELDDMRQLEQLDLYDNNLTSLAGLPAEMPSLRVLDVSFNPLGDEDTLQTKSLPKLEELYRIATRLGRIPPSLGAFGGLRVLELGANRIRKLEGLEMLVHLEQLWVGKNKIVRIEGLGSLVRLKLLSIQSNRLQSLEGLGGLPALEELYASHNAITGLEGLGGVPKLRVLDLASNRLTEIPRQLPLPDLQELWLNDNPLTEFPGLADASPYPPGLTTLYLEHTPLASGELRPDLIRRLLVAYPKLEELDIQY